MRIIDQHEVGLLKEFSDFLIGNGLPYSEVNECFHEFLDKNQISELDKLIESINEETRKIKEIDKKLRRE